MIRWTTALILAGSLVAAFLFDRVDPQPNDAVVIPVVERLTPSMAEVPALGSTWFCAVGSSGPDSFADSEVIVANISDDDAVANLDVRTADGAGPSQRVTVAARSAERVLLSELGTFDVAGVTVEVIGGEGVVSHRVQTSAGTTEGPCSSQASSTWYFAGGPTTRDTKQYIALLNPFANDVVFRATFQTPSRTRQPNELDGRTVPAQSVLLIDVGEFVARESVVATTIEAVAGGQLVVERLLVVDGALGPAGASLEAALAMPALTWTAPAGRVHDGGDNTLTVFNPSAEVAEVDVRLDPLDPEDRVALGLVAIELTVQPGRLATVDLRSVAEQLVLPLPYDLGVSVVSANGVPVVAQRLQLQPGIDGLLVVSNVSERRRQNDGEVPADELPVVPEGPAYAQATARRGVAVSHGSPVSSTRWVTASASLLPDNGSAVVVFGEVGALIEVRLVIGGSVGSPVRASVDPTGRAVIPLTPIADQAAVVVTSDEPIVAEIQLVSADRFDAVPMVPTVPASDATTAADS